MSGWCGCVCDERGESDVDQILYEGAIEAILVRREAEKTASKRRLPFCWKFWVELEAKKLKFGSQSKPEN